MLRLCSNTPLVLQGAYKVRRGEAHTQLALQCLKWSSLLSTSWSAKSVANAFLPCIVTVAKVQGCNQHGPQ
jgi:hypothetical protein